MKIFLSALTFLLLAGCGEPPAVEHARPLPSPRDVAQAEAVSEVLTILLTDLGTALRSPAFLSPAFLSPAFLSSNTADLEPFFDPEVSARPFPVKTGDARPVHAGIFERTWTIEGDVVALPRDALLSSLKAFFGRFASIEDVSFEVPSSEVESGRIDAQVAIAVVARDTEGRREWVRGTLTVSARAVPGGRPRITAFTVRSLTSMVAEEDLMSDVTEAAGVAASDPPLAEAMARLEHWYPNGAAAVDVDRDGLMDLFVTGPETNRLYLNRGDGTFVDVAAEAGVRGLRAGQPELVPLFFDYDEDGDADLFVTSLHENLLYENRLVPDGILLFRDVSLGLPQVDDVQGWSVAAADVDGDGDVDLYVPSYASATRGPVARTTIWDRDGKPNLLYLNQGDGTFVEAAEAWGVADRRFGMAAQFADIDGDHDPDLYVANDYGGGNCLFINHGDRFVDEAEARGVLHAAQSMGVSFSDYDNDGDLDLHVTNMSSTAAARALARYDGAPLKHREHLARQWSGNALFENRGDGTFRDASAEAGPFLGGWGWGGGFLDLDNDGWEDLHQPNGFFSGVKRYDTRSFVFGTAITATQGDAVEAEMGSAMSRMVGMLIEDGLSFAGYERDRVYLNRGDGRFVDGDGRFVDVSGVSGADSPSDGRAAVYADFDNDGDLDIFLRATHGRAHFLFRNDIGQNRGFLRVALDGRASGHDAFGAVVRVKTATRTLTRAKRASNGYLAQSDPRLVFGLGDETEVEWIEVRWPSGTVQRFSGPFESGTSVVLTEGEEMPVRVEEKRFRLAG